MGALLLPFVLARRHVLELDGLQLPVITLSSLAGLALVSRRCGFGGLGTGVSWFAFATGFGGGCVMFGASALHQGTSFPGLVHGMVFQHLGFMEGFYENPPIYAWSAPLALISLAAAVASVRGWPLAPRLVRLGLIVLVTGVCLRHLADTFTPIHHGANDRGQAALLVSLFTPLLWILWLPFCETDSRHDDVLQQSAFARLLLGTVAVLQPLGAYPIPGTQMALGSLGLLLALLVAVGDVLRFPATIGADASLFRRSVAAGLLGLSLLTVACRVTYLSRVRSTLVPLELPGAQRLRLPTDFVASARWTVDQLRSRGETFICFQNGHNSLYFWSELDPPTPLNTTLWQDLLDDQRQQRIVSALTQRRRACVVWHGSEPLPHRQDGPLTRFVLANFQPVARRGDTEIWARE